MRIRPADERDLEALTAIYNHAVEHSTATFDLRPQAPAERLDWLRAHNRENHPLLVAEEGTTVMGYASLSAFAKKPAYASTAELSLYVGEAFRRRGVGLALAEAVLRLAREDSRTHLVLSLITAENAASIALHRRLGFTRFGVLPEAGWKFGRYLSVEYWGLLVG